LTPRHCGQSAYRFTVQSDKAAITANILNDELVIVVTFRLVS
jgi:hypothetical protein